MGIVYGTGDGRLFFVRLQAYPGAIGEEHVARAVFAQVRPLGAVGDGLGFGAFQHAIFVVPQRLMRRHSRACMFVRLLFDVERELVVEIDLNSTPLKERTEAKEQVGQHRSRMCVTAVESFRQLSVSC